MASNDDLVAAIWAATELDGVKCSIVPTNRQGNGLLIVHLPQGRGEYENAEKRLRSLGCFVVTQVFNILMFQLELRNVKPEQFGNYKV